VLFVLPSLFILIGLSWIYVAFGEVPLVAGLFYGIKPAVAAIVLQAVWRIGSKTLKSPRPVPCGPWRSAALWPLPRSKCRFPWVVLPRRVTGWLGALGTRASSRRAGGHGPAKARRPALIDDDTPTPEHARFSRSRLAARWWLVGALLWLLPMGAAGGQRLARHADADGLVLHQGRVADLWRRLCRAALCVPGRGGAVWWLTGPQMIDGLALGETTPAR
jgi:chromate transporter